MAWNSIYVDPSIAASSGTGTVGDPYGDLNYAVAQKSATPFAGGNSDWFRIVSATTEVLSASLTMSAWTPAYNKHIRFSGDGVRFDLDCNGFKMFAGSYNFLHVITGEIYNSGAGGNLIDLGSNGSVYDCILHGSNATLVSTGNRCLVSANYLYDCTTYGISAGLGTGVRWNFVKNSGSRNFTAGIYIASTDGICRNNVVTFAGNRKGIYIGNQASRVFNNSIWGTDKTAGSYGIEIEQTFHGSHVILNNVVGKCATGIEIATAAGGYSTMTGGNHVYDCTTAYVLSTDTVIDLGDNESQSATSPFTDPSTDDFSPVVVGNMHAAWPTAYPDAWPVAGTNKIWKGAIQKQGGAVSPQNKLL